MQAGQGGGGDLGGAGALGRPYNQEIADALDGDGRTFICDDNEQPMDDSDTSVVCALYSLDGPTAWQIDVMLGLGNHFSSELMPDRKRC